MNPFKKIFGKGQKDAPEQTAPAPEVEQSAPVVAPESAPVEQTVPPVEEKKNEHVHLDLLGHPIAPSPFFPHSKGLL